MRKPRRVIFIYRVDSDCDYKCVAITHTRTLTHTITHSCTFVWFSITWNVFNVCSRVCAGWQINTELHVTLTLPQQTIMREFGELIMQSMTVKHKRTDDQTNIRNATRRRRRRRCQQKSYTKFHLIANTSQPKSRACKPQAYSSNTFFLSHNIIWLSITRMHVRSFAARLR